jgi:hypothetical protein
LIHTSTLRHGQHKNHQPSTFDFVNHSPIAHPQAKRLAANSFLTLLFATKGAAAKSSILPRICCDTFRGIAF